jgi:hypothetical protein
MDPVLNLGYAYEVFQSFLVVGQSAIHTSLRLSLTDGPFPNGRDADPNSKFHKSTTINLVAHATHLFLDFSTVPRISS